jgi:two-component system cell cycle sensor histidine kinase PleC
MIDPHPALKADRRAVIRIILNLLSNAIKFTPAGGHIILRCAARDSGISIAVIDTGVGMTHEQIPIALSAFGQLHNAYTRSHQGTGLGLPMVKALAEQHGGSLRIDSTPGEGTTVTVWLPQVACPPATEDEAGLSPTV